MRRVAYSFPPTASRIRPALQITEGRSAQWVPLSRHSELGAEALRKFESGFHGEVLPRGYPGYDPARTLFNAMIDRHPAVIARRKDLSDVQRALEFAQTHHLPLAIRGGGHNVAGKALCDEGLVVDLSRMKMVGVDPGGPHGAGRGRAHLG